MSGDRASCWSVTLNMKNVSRERCEDMIDQAKQANWGVQGQIEEGKEGKPHYQLLVKTPQVRFAAVKRVFPTAHIEKARNPKALEAYVHKDEGRLEEMKTIERKFVQFPEVRKKFFQWVIEEGYDQVSDYDRKLALWDEFIGLSIRVRIECDVIGVNPQYRGIIQRYWNDYVIIAQEDIQISLDRQTDRQTADILVSEDSITNGEGRDEEEELTEGEYTSEDDEDNEISEGQTTSTDTESINSGISEKLYTPFQRNQIQRNASSKGTIQWHDRQRR